MFLPTSRETVLALAAALASYASFKVSSRTDVKSPAASTRPYSHWSTIEPSRELRYYECEGGEFQCARLRVPKDWSRTGVEAGDGDDNNVDIAIVRLPARVSVTDPRYGGVVILNPGGPGYSGVRAAITQGHSAQTIFDAAYTNGTEYLSDAAHARYYDIIGFDPRGINNTTPYFSCLPTKSAEIQWALQVDEAVLGSPDVDPLYLLARASAYGSDCALSGGSKSVANISRFMNTPAVVRDVVEIAERHGQWREAQAVGHGPEVRERLRWHCGKEIINFWGLSYGAMLGASLAGMEPNRVGRFLLDGPNDPHDFYSANVEANLDDSDAAFHYLFAICASAGPELCALWNGPSGNDTERLLRSIIERIVEEGPVAVPGDGQDRGAQVVTLSDVRTALNAAVLLPAKYWFPVAAAIEPLVRNNGTMLAIMKANTRPILTGAGESITLALDRIDPRDTSTHTHHWAHGRRPGAAVVCLDGPPKHDPKEFLAQWEAMKRRSTWMSDYWATLAIDCVGWIARPVWNDANSHALVPNTTANPILFASSSLDPVTPLAMARRLQGRFSGSGLIQVSGAGHTSISRVSLCAGKAYRRYFQTGEVSHHIFCDSNTVTASTEDSTLTREELAIAEALKKAMEVWL